FRRHCLWDMDLKQEPTQRQRLFRTLHTRLLPLPHTDRWKVLDELSAWSERGSEIRPTHRPLTAGEVQQLADGALIEIGAHTVTHPVLSKQPTIAQREEI